MNFNAASFMLTTRMIVLDNWNTLTLEDAAMALLPCCGSPAWAADVASRRPLATLPELLAASDAAWWSLTEENWTDAFNAHPRIGERHAQSNTTAASLAWSATEQSAAMTDEAAQAALAAGQRAYEQRFHRIFLVRAAGRSAQQILTELQRRMTNTAEAELHEAAEQQREITHLRLQKWLTA